MLARIAVFLVIVFAGFWMYLLIFPNSKGYAENLSNHLKEKLAADEIELDGFERQRGEFQIAKMAMIGGEETFFSELDVRNLRCEMGLFDTFDKGWDPGVIEISRVELSLRAGADSEVSSNAIAEVLFQETGRVKVDTIQVADATLRWGYSKRTQGKIVGSKMRARRVENGWRLMFRGGSFSQNWLKRLEIIELDVLISKDEIVFEKAEFRKGQGTITFPKLKIEAGQRPVVTGRMELRKMDLSYLIPMAARGVVEGRVSGDFEVTGSTNSTEGIGFSGKVELEGEDVIILRDRIQLLRALSVVDALNNYKRVNFREGSFKLKAHGGRLELSAIKLKAEDLLTLSGNLAVRAPTSREALEFFENEKFSGTIRNDDELEDDQEGMTLENAAEASRSKGDIGFESGDDQSLFDKLGLRTENRLIEEKTAERLIQSYRYEGLLTITLRENAFARAPLLAEVYPVDITSNRVSVDVPIEGLLFEITADQAEEIYKKGTR